jgi:hypothetical protein
MLADRSDFAARRASPRPNCDSQTISVFAANSIGGTNARCVEEDPRRDFKGFGDIYKPLVQDSAFPVFDVDENVPGHSRSQGQGFLRHALGQSKSADVAPDNGPGLLPFRDTLRAVLAGACRHAISNPSDPRQCLPY